MTTPRLLTREQILAAKDRPVEAVHVAGVALRLRAPSAGLVGELAVWAEGVPRAAWRSGLLLTLTVSEDRPALLRAITAGLDEETLERLHAAAARLAGDSIIDDWIAMNRHVRGRMRPEGD